VKHAAFESFQWFDNVPSKSLSLDQMNFSTFVSERLAVIEARPTGNKK
jgi:hypothetical protein